MIQIACQTIVFGNNFKDIITEVAGTIKKIGYDGMETGARHFYLDKPEFYKDLFEKLDLKLTAIHVGGDFLNKESVQKQLDNIKNIVKFARFVGCPRLFLSGLKKEGKTRDEYALEAQSYTEIGKICAAEGLVFCYHNHDWEFYRDGSEGMKTLLENVPADLMKLVPDVGWLEVAGVPPLQFLKDNIDRVHAIHFKDFKSTAVPREFTELGAGITPFKEIFDYAAGLDRDWWIIAEQDHSEIGPAESARINFEFINSMRK